MTHPQIEHFLSGLACAEDPWADRIYAPQERPASWVEKLGVHGAAIALGMALGTLAWQAAVHVTVADVVVAAAQLP